MQANRDEAVKCLNIARRALRDGDKGKAKRFAEKAGRLGGAAVADQVASVLGEIESAPKENGASSSRQNGTSERENLRRRESARASPAPSSREAEDQGTPEQRALVKRINGCKDYYSILGISDKTCDEDVIKRSYKKLALKLHPDKCRVRGAEEAFKAVSRSFSCLSDPQKRRSYDRYGSEQPGFPSSSGGGGGSRGFYRANTQEIDPEELFNMFFGGSPVFGHTHFHRAGGMGGAGFRSRGPRARAGGGTQDPSAGFNLGAIIQLLPILFLVLFTLLGNSPSEPVYSLHMQGKYNARETTAMRGVDFYVKSHAKFNREYPHGTYARRRVDVSVESDYKQYLENECWRERIRYRSGSTGNKKKAAVMKSCTKLEEIYKL